VRLAGEKVSIPPFTVAHACVETSARQLIAHELRWSRTIRRVDPLGHLGSVLLHPLAFALFAVMLSGAAAWSLQLVLATVVARLALELVSDHVLRQAHRDAVGYSFLCDIRGELLVVACDLARLPFRSRQ
jgi:ceramide glucosyltransferase